MLIANRLKETNRAEYLLYMWQVEDLLRAYDCDADRLQREYLSRFDCSDGERAEAARWYADLCDMLLSEGKRQKGHLQICHNILDGLTELHEKLLRDPRFSQYSAAYYKALPHIVELRARQGEEVLPELETCFDAMYGIWLLKMQQKEISAETAAAVGHIADLLARLSAYWKKDKAGEIDWD